MPVRSLINLHEEVDRLLADVGLQAFAGTPAAELSYGRKRALEVATTLALKPELLLLDEPTAGMDANDVERVVDLIKSVSKNRTVVIVEHNLSVVARLSDRVTVLTRGEIVAEGDYATVSRDPRVVEAYLGTVDA
jgi:branched-chain amino acid transport system ATP-binding protein